jgi:hypothetical protein
MIKRTGRRLLDEPPPEFGRAAALTTWDRCASDDPCFPGTTPVDPLVDGTVLVCPATVVVVVGVPVPFDRVPRVVVAVTGPDPAPVLTVVGVADAPGATVGVVVGGGGAGAEDVWVGATSVEALQIWA